MADKQQFTPGVSLAGAVDLESLKHKVETAPGDRGGAPAAGAYVIDTTQSGFEAMVKTSATFPILLLLWVPTDDRLFPMARELGDAVNAQEGKIQLSRIDIAENPTISQAFQVQGAPALFALIGGRPMPILQGLPAADELDQIRDQVIPRLIEVAHRAGVTGTAPYAGTKPVDDADGSEDAQTDAVPPEHEEAHRLAEAEDWSGAAAAYQRVLEENPSDLLAARERAKALLLARSGKADVRAVRRAAAERSNDVEAQLAVADVDMIGGQIDDAFGRLLDFLDAHRSALPAVRTRLLEYFAIPDSADPRLRRARRRLAALMY